MTLALTDILLLFIVLAGFGYVLSSTRVRERALQSVLLASRRDGYQLLDQNVQLRRLSLSRDGRGRWRIWRQYRFDYSLDGEGRRQGHVIMLGHQLQAVVVSTAPTVH